MSGLDYYIDLLGDTRRIEAFLRATRAVVRPVDHVLDVGTGLGTFARAAAQAGARRVTAIEANPLAAAYARELGLVREFGGRVRLVEARAEQAALDEPADVVLFEDYGRFVWHPGLPRILEALRGRLARPGARYIPECIELFAAPVDTALPVRFQEAPFSPEAVELLRKRASSLASTAGVSPSDLIGPAIRVGEFRPGEPVPPRLRYTGTLRAARAGHATGLAGWMRLRLAGEIILDNDPASAPTAWKQLIFPFEAPVPVAEGEELEVEVEVAHGPGPSSELWRWALRGRHPSEGSTANALPGDLEYLLRGSPDFVPSPSPWHAAVADVLRLIEARKAMAEIAAAVYNRHRPLFVSETGCLDWVMELVTALRSVMGP